MGPTPRRLNRANVCGQSTSCAREEGVLLIDGSVTDDSPEGVMQGSPGRRDFLHREIRAEHASICPEGVDHKAHHRFEHPNQVRALHGGLTMEIPSEDRHEQPRDLARDVGKLGQALHPGLPVLSDVLAVRGGCASGGERSSITGRCTRVTQHNRHLWVALGECGQIVELMVIHRRVETQPELAQCRISRPPLRVAHQLAVIAAVHDRPIWMMSQRIAHTTEPRTRLKVRLEDLLCLGADAQVRGPDDAFEQRSVQTFEPSRLVDCVNRVFGLPTGLDVYDPSHLSGRGVRYVGVGQIVVNDVVRGTKERHGIFGEHPVGDPPQRSWMASQQLHQRRRLTGRSPRVPPMNVSVNNRQRHQTSKPRRPYRNASRAPSGNAAENPSR